jgi:hypothetical protein
MADRPSVTPGGDGMKTVVIAFSHRLMAQSVAHTLSQTGRFRIHITDPMQEDPATVCQSLQADVLLLEGKHRICKDQKLSCKTVVMCDDNSAPEVLQQVVIEKKLGKIDDFVFFSISEHYLTALLSSL